MEAQTTIPGVLQALFQHVGEAARPAEPDLGLFLLSLGQPERASGQHVTMLGAVNAQANSG